MKCEFSFSARKSRAMNIQWFSVVLLCICFASGERVVRTTTGNVRSTEIQLHDGKEIEAFLGIPYAQPPVGKLRFERPIPISPWEGEYNATVLPPPCYQNFTYKFYWTPNVERMTEDCLYLNLWVPGSLQDRRPKAVFVWIHGGAFNIGSSEMEHYNGAVLASRGNIIVASLNYRVGIFGFLTTPVPEAAGNMGIYDQILAMEWIKTNIKAFGGNPELITLAGESAGAMSAALFLVSPLTRGLVKRAILESGGIVLPMSGSTTQNMMKIAELVASAAGCSSGAVNMTSNAKMIVDCLKHLPPNVISEAEGLIMKSHPISASPHNDGIVTPRDPVQMLISGDFQDTEVLLGGNKDEGSSFLTYILPEYFGIYGANAAILKKRIAAYMIKNVFLNLEQSDTDAIVRFYVDGEGNRKQLNEIEDGVDYMKTALYDSIGDFLIMCPTMFQADFLSTKSKPVYFYLFTHRPSTTVNADWMGVAHFDEVPFVFGRPLTGDKNYTEEDKDISVRMMDRWIAFTKTGSPNIPGALKWPPYKWYEPIFLDIGEQDKVRKKPDDHRCEFWRDRFRANMDSFKAETLRSHGVSIQKKLYALVTFFLFITMLVK